MTYAIGEKKYTQKKLALGQVEQLIDLLQGLDIPELTVQGIMKALDDKLWLAIAIVIREEGNPTWYEKDLDAMTLTMKWDLDAETALAIVTDFFACNPITSLLEQVAGMSTKLQEQSTAIAALKASGRLSESSAAATSPAGTGSDGT